MVDFSGAIRYVCEKFLIGELNPHQKEAYGVLSNS